MSENTSPPASSSVVVTPKTVGGLGDDLPAQEKQMANMVAQMGWFLSPEFLSGKTVKQYFRNKEAAPQAWVGVGGDRRCSFAGKTKDILGKLVGCNSRGVDDYRGEYNLFAPIHAVSPLAIEGIATASENYSGEVVGVKKADVICPQVMVVEIDSGEVTEADAEEFHDKWGATATLISSPGKLHVYWRLEDQEGKTDWEEFRQGQEFLTHKFGGDPAHIHAPQKLMRVAGGVYNKGLLKGSKGRREDSWVSCFHRISPNKTYKGVREVIADGIGLKWEKDVVEGFLENTGGGGRTEWLLKLA